MSKTLLAQLTATEELHHELLFVAFNHPGHMKSVGPLTWLTLTATPDKLIFAHEGTPDDDIHLLVSPSEVTSVGPPRDVTVAAVHFERALEKMELGDTVTFSTSDTHLLITMANPATKRELQCSLRQRDCGSR